MPTKRALELVALRGKDVVGVRHLVDGRAYVGIGPDSVARIALTGDSSIIAEVAGGEYLLRVPPRYRARLHGADGLGRLLMGPAEVSLCEGDRAVVVLGPIQVRAQIVPIEVISRSASASRWLTGSADPGLGGAFRWIGLVGAVYLLALAICAGLAPRDRAELQAGVVQRAAAAAQATVMP